MTSANATNQVALCAGNATFGTSGGVLAVQIPSACVGSPAEIKFGAVFRYNWTASTPAREDEAPNGDDAAGPVTSATTPASHGGAVVLDSFGELHRVNVGGLPSSAIWSEYASLGTPRGVAITPDGGHGYVVSGSGRLFGISFARNNLPPRVFGAKSWPGLNRARGVAIRPNGSAGLVVDAFGNLYPFGIGGKRVIPQLFGVPKWPGVDMARGVAVLPNGQGGFTLDAFGGLNWFSIGTARAAPPLFGVASFPGNDAARGVSILPDGTGGFVVDKSGQLHFFSIGAPMPPDLPEQRCELPGRPSPWRRDADPPHHAPLAEPLRTRPRRRRPRLGARPAVHRLRTWRGTRVGQREIRRRRVGIRIRGARPARVSATSTGRVGGRRRSHSPGTPLRPAWSGHRSRTAGARCSRSSSSWCWSARSGRCRGC